MPVQRLTTSAISSAVTLLLQQLEALGFGFLRGVQLFFQLRNSPVLDFGDLGQIAMALRGFDFAARLLDLLLELRRALHRGLLGLPDFVEVGELALELGDVGFQIGQALLGFLVLLLLQRLALDLQLDQAALQAVEFLGLGVDLHADARRGLVHQVDRLVRQLAVGDVAVRQRRGGDDRRIGDLDAVVHGVAFLQAAQDRDRVFDARFADKHFLEAPLERGIFLDVLAVFVERRRADAMQFAARERRLEHVAGIHRAFGLAGADHRVQFVDEQDDVAFFLGQILEHGFEAFLEFAAELRAGDQRAHVERQHAPVAQAFGHLAVDDALREPFDDRGLADAGLADQHRIVLRAPLQHLDHAADFLVAADDGIELGFLGARGQVDRVFLQRLALFLGILVFHFFASAHILDRGFEVRLVRAGRLEAWPTSPLSSSAASTNSSLAMNASPRCCASLSVRFNRRVRSLETLMLPSCPLTAGSLSSAWPMRVRSAATLTPAWASIGVGRAALLIEQRRHQVRRLEHVVVAPDRQRLGIGQRLLKTRSQFVHSHRQSTFKKRGRHQGSKERQPPQTSSSSRRKPGSSSLLLLGAGAVRRAGFRLSPE